MERVNPEKLLRFGSNIFSERVKIQFLVMTSQRKDF